MARQGPGWIAWRAPGGAAVPSPTALAFERQRLPEAAFVATEAGARLDDAILQGAAARARGLRGPLTLHVFAPESGAGAASQAPAARLERRLREAWAAMASEGFESGAPPLLSLEPDADARPGGTVWQVCLLPEGAWWSVAPTAALADAFPGGVHRMEREAGAPSRSYLKVREALDVLGRPSRARERVIDLGAAPGGWSYAFLQLGCRVLAVDNGPLRLPGLDDLPGELTHLRADGLRLRPPPEWLPADWLLSDMLVPPGVCLGLLRKWIGGGWARRFIVNVKLPQREPLAALQPLRDYLAAQPHVTWRLRQLYHDRREVTLLGELRGVPAAMDAPGKRATPRGARTRRPRPAPARRGARGAKPGRRSATGR